MGSDLGLLVCCLYLGKGIQIKLLIQDKNRVNS